MQMQVFKQMKIYLYFIVYFSTPAPLLNTDDADVVTFGFD